VSILPTQIWELLPGKPPETQYDTIYKAIIFFSLNQIVMRKISIGIFLIWLSLLSCTTQNSNVQLSAVLQTLNLSNQHIEFNNKLVYAALDERLKDPSTHSKATKWNPKAKAIKLIIDSAINYIDQLRIELRTSSGIKGNVTELLNRNEYNSVDELFNKKKKGDELAIKMYVLKNSLINTLSSHEYDDEPYLNEYVKQAKAKLNKEMPVGDTNNVETNSAEFDRNRYSGYFKNTNTIGAMVMLAKIQNDVLLSENLMINFMINQTNAHTLICTQILPLVIQNSSILKYGQEIEITAGIGSFSTVKSRFLQ
jgi:hypothetical protein